MSPMAYQAALRARGFIQESSGRWHGPFGLIIPATYNNINTTSLADRARDEQIAQIDQAIEVKRRNYNAK